MGQRVVANAPREVGHHMRKSTLCLTLLALAGSATLALAQGMPTTQPKFLQIYREDIKPGRAADHAKWEAGWPAAFEKAKSKYQYIALESITGPPEAWFVQPLASQAAYGEMEAEGNSPALAPEMERLAKGDAEFLSAQSAIQAVAVPELSYGAFPDIGKMRYWEITTFRVKPGYYESWVAATKAYKSATARTAPNASWRTYEVVAGAPGGTYLIFSSVGSFADFDKAAAEGEATWKGMTAEESAALTSFMKEGVFNTVTQRYRLNPRMSYVDAETRAKDPAFWNPKP
jgi:hypothetical protein